MVVSLGGGMGWDPVNNFQAHVYPVSDSFKEKYFNPHLAAFRGMYVFEADPPIEFYHSLVWWEVSSRLIDPKKGWQYNVQ